MPSRPVVVGIVLFWVAVLLAVANRELVPRLFGGKTPAPEFGPEDELSGLAGLEVRWAIYRGPAAGPADEKVGTMTSKTQFVEADSSFWLVYAYRGVKLRTAAVTLTIPNATSKVRVTRDGRLLQQEANGSADVELGGAKVKVGIDVEGVVTDGHLEGTATLTAADLLPEPLTTALQPVPVPEGQVLNPLMPTDHLKDVVPGRRWMVHQVDPLRDAVGELASKGLKEAVGRGVTLPAAPKLRAKVLDEPQWLDRPGGRVSCWVIEYECDDPPTLARTWVRRDDGRVLRQETAAYAYDERIRFEREE